MKVSLDAKRLRIYLHVPIIFVEQNDISYYQARKEGDDGLVTERNKITNMARI